MKIRNKQELQELTSLVSELSLLRFFPAEPAATLALVRDLANLVQSMDEARWLVQEMRRLHNDWPGPAELAAVYKTRPRTELPARCPECRDSDWVWHDGGLGRCGCARGQALTAREKAAEDEMNRLIERGAVPPERRRFGAPGSKPAALPAPKKAAQLTPVRDVKLAASGERE